MEENNLKINEVKQIEETEENVFSEEVLLVQQLLNQIEINESQLEANGFYNKETEQAIKKLQQITDFIPNGVIDQNLMFRLNEIIENPIITEYNQNRTFAVLYNKYKNQ